MHKRIGMLGLLLGALLATRLILMAIVPLADTTEPRYAEIARLMAESGDWITPYFEPGVPFWGKPPLAFWAEALAFRLFGVNEFAARLPSLLATLGIIALIFLLARAYGNRRAAWLASLVYGSSALAYIASGAVLTDPFLALGTTLAMTAFALACRTPGSVWRYLFFLGIAIGLLAKGPVAAILIAGPIALWLLAEPNRRQVFARFPWIAGCALAGLLTLPWYLAAELKTPGFLRYFLVGEHFMRFFDPAWSGDLYGAAHLRPRGTIWLYWLFASFPWGIVGLALVARHLARRDGLAAVFRWLKRNEIRYLLAWALFAMLFFTPARNILWTYALPALPALAVLLGLYLDGYLDRRAFDCDAISRFGQGPLLLRGGLALTAVALLLAGAAVAVNHDQFRTEKELIVNFERAGIPGAKLLFVAQRPFSARFYSRGKAGLVPLDALAEAVARSGGSHLFLAVPLELVTRVRERTRIPSAPRFQNRRYALLEVAADAATASVQAPSASARRLN